MLKGKLSFSNFSGISDAGVVLISYMKTGVSSKYVNIHWVFPMVISVLIMY